MNHVTVDLDPTTGFAYVKAKLLIPAIPYVNTIELQSIKIDTGSDISMIFDNDLIQLCSDLGYIGKYDCPAILNWMSYCTCTGIFKKDNRKIDCPSGSLKDVFKITKSYLSLYDNQGFIRICAEGDSAIRCCFSTPFIEAESSEQSNKSHVPLLGTRNLKLLDEMIWKYQNDKVHLLKN